MTLLPPQPDFSAWVRQVWAARNAGHIFEAEALYAAGWQTWTLAASAGPGEHYEILKSRGVAGGTIVDFLLLAVSFLRRNQRLAEAASRLKTIQALAETDGVHGSFALAFQTGLNALAGAERHQALSAFGKARRFAEPGPERFYAEFNFVLCLEDLGLPYEGPLQTLARDLAPHAAADWAVPVLAQLQALRARAAYRQCDIESLKDLYARGVDGDQARYYLAWVQQLPVFTALETAPAMAEDSALLHLAGRGAEAYLSQYELMTLKGVLVADDLSAEVKTSEHLERLYLWTWQWLVAPSAGRLVKLAKLQAYLVKTLKGVLSRDEWLHLACSLRWVALFLGLESDAASRLLGELGDTGTAAVPVLEYEEILLDYLFACRDQNDATALLSRLEAHPLAAQTAFLLPGLLQALARGAPPPHPLAKLHASLQELSSPLPRPVDGVVVDARTAAVQVFTGGRSRPQIKAPSLARLLILAAGHETLSASVIMQTCFGLTRFDEDRHEGKLAKLLWSANQAFAPFVRWHRRGLNISVTKQAAALAIAYGNAHCLQLLADESIFDAMVRPPPRLSGGAKAENGPLLTGEFSRKELEERLGLSKTAILQKLEEWTKLGQVERRGTGKATRYRVAAL